MQISVLGEVMVTDEGQELPLSHAEKEVIAELCVRSNRWCRVGGPLSLAPLRALAARLPGTAGPQILIDGENAVLRVDEDGLDSLAFEIEAARAKTSQVSDPQLAIAIATTALARWRGAAFGSLATRPALVAEASRLGGVRVELEERLIELLLLNDYIDDALERAERLCAERPSRDRVNRQLIVSLQRKGLRARAIEHCSKFRAVLAASGELPSTEFTELELHLLLGRQDQYATMRAHPESKSREPFYRLPDPPTVLEADGLIDRVAERQWFRDRLADVAQGNPCIAFIMGEAGIGKSWLARHVGRMATRIGFRVFVARCDRAPSASTTLSDLENWLEGRSTYHPGSDLQASDPDDAPTAFVLGEQGMRSRIQKLTDTVCAAAREQPFVIVVDDLQWADSATLEWVLSLSRVTSDMPVQEPVRVLVVLTVRVEQGVALPPEAMAIRREPVSRTMTLSGLSEAGVGLLLRKQRGRQPSSAFTRDVFRITRGNPLFVDSIARSVGIQSVSDVWQQHLIPGELDEAIATRLRAVDVRAAETLALAAVVGEPFDLPLLATLQGIEPPQLYEIVSEVTRLGLTVREGSAVRFAHPLFASAAAELLDLDRRRSVSTAAAHLLVERWAKGEDAPVLRIAELIGHDEAAFTPELRRSVATAAAHAALESYEWEAAGRWFATAARAERQMPNPSAVAEAELLRQAGAAYVNAGDVAYGVSLYERALPLLDEDRDRVPLVRLRCELLQALMVSLPPGSPIDTTQLERFAPTIEVDAPRVSALAYSNLVQAFWASGRNDDARAAARRGIEIGTNCDEPLAVERSYQALAMAHWYRLELTDAASALQAAVDVTERVGEHRRQAASLIRLALTHAWLGSTRDTAIEIERARALFRTANYSIEAPLLCVADAMLALARGEYSAVDDHVADGLAQVALSGYPWATTLLWANLARARLLSGRTEDLALVNQQLAPPSRSATTARGAHLVDVLAHADLTRVAELELDTEALAIDRSWLQIGSDASLALLAEVAYFHERADLAAAVLPHLNELWSRGQLFTSTMMMLLPRVVGLAQWTVGERTAAEGTLRRATLAAEEAAAHSELALTEFALARCLSHDESRRSNAADHAARARRLTNVLGLEFLRRALDELEQSIGPTSNTAARPADAALHVETACIMFTDIASSTSLTEELGDWVFRSKARPLELELRAAIERHHGYVVDAITLGDGLLANFSSARDAVAAALTCEEISLAHELPLHIGLHAGDVLRERGNLFGGAVNLAARVCSLCEPGRVLASQTFRDLARTSSDATFVEHGVFDLKGVRDPARLFEVSRRDAAMT